MKNRALRAIDELQRAGDRGLLACELTRLLKVDFSGRPINEAISKGYVIESVFEEHRALYGTHTEKRYFYRGSQAQQAQPKFRWVFDNEIGMAKQVQI